MGKVTAKDIVKWGHIFYVLAAFLTLGLFALSILLERKDDVPVPFADAWYRNAEMTEAEDLKHPVLTDNKAVFYATVPSDIKLGDDLWFKAKNAYLTVSVGGQIRLFRPNEEYSALYGRTPGTDWFCIPLEREDAGKLVKIEFSTNYHDKSAYIDEIYIGHALDNIRFALTDRISGAVLCILMIFFGLALIGAHIMFSLRIKEMTNELLYLGAAEFFLAVWSLSELRVLQLFTEKNAGLFHNLSCMSLMMVILPLILYFKEDIDHVNRYFTGILLLLAGLNFGVCNVLHFAGLFDFHQTLTLTHATAIISVSIILYANFLRIHHRRETDRGGVKTALCLLFVLLAAILDIIRYKAGGVKDASFFTRIAMFLYLILLEIRSLLNVLRLTEKGVESDIIARLAYEDGLTGLGNRTAYNERIEELNGKEACVFLFDINHLKYVNDHFGHSAGDEMIKTSAEVINSVFEEIGRCYRVGGDEFVCLAEGKVDTERYTREFYRRIQMLNKLKILDFPLAVALGCAVCGSGENLKEATDAADQRMYQKKKELKQGENGMYSRDEEPA